MTSVRSFPLRNAPDALTAAEADFKEQQAEAKVAFLAAGQKRVADEATLNHLAAHFDTNTNSTTAA